MFNFNYPDYDPIVNSQGNENKLINFVNGLKALSYILDKDNPEAQKKLHEKPKVRFF